MIRMRFLPLLLCFSIIAGCRDNPVTTSGGGSVIMPLKVGNEWTYRIVEYDSTGASTAASSEDFRVDSDTVIGGERYAVMSSGGLLINRSRGLWTGFLTTFEPDPIAQTHSAVYPAVVGDTAWSWPTDIQYSGGPVLFHFQEVVRLVSTDTLITVPAGSYHCYHYRTRVEPDMGSNEPFWNNHGRKDDFYVPDKGLIKGEYSQMTFAGQVYVVRTLELSSLSLR